MLYFKLAGTDVKLANPYSSRIGSTEIVSSALKSFINS